MSNTVNRITNANIYDSGNSLCGKAEEVTLPGIKSIFNDHKALGMMVAIELPSGIDKMTGKIKWNAIYPDVITKYASPYNTVQLQVRSSLETYDSSGRIAQKPVVAFITVRFKDALSAIVLKQNDNPEIESEFSCTYMRLEVDGVKLVEIDAMSNIYFVNGVDQMAEYSSNLGLD